MGSKYSSKSISGYNASPPADDGSVVDTNKTKWAQVTDKIGGPVKTLAEAINDALVTHFDLGPVSISANDTLDDTHYGKTIEVSAGATLTLTDASTLGTGWNVLVKNVDTTSVSTIAPQTTADTFDSEVVTSITIAARESIFVQVVNAANGFLTVRGNEFQSLLNVINDGQALVANAGSSEIVGWAPRNHISGLELSNNSTDAANDIDIAVGEASDSTNGYVLKLTSGLTKQMDNPFAPGTDAGGMFNASKETGISYHAFLIHKTDNGTIDVGFSTSVSAADIPSGYAVFRRIGTVMTDFSGNIVPFRQRGDRFLLETISNDVASANDPGISAVTAILNVPLGVVFRAIINARVFHNENNNDVKALFTELAAPDYTATAVNNNYASIIFSTTATSYSTGHSAGLEVWTDTTKQIRYRLSESDADTYVDVWTLGWYDERK